MTNKLGDKQVWMASILVNKQIEGTEASESRWPSRALEVMLAAQNLNVKD
jgi:hypothetical protein